MITSKDNKYIKLARSLKQKKYREKHSLFVVEGENIVREALEKNIVLHCFTTNDSNSDMTLVSDEVMNSMTSFKTHVNYLAVCKNIKLENTSNKKVLVLDNIQDPGNLGTLIRSALAFSFDKVICSLNTVDVYNYKCISATQGAILKIPVEYLNLEEYLLSSQNTNIAATIDGDAISKVDADFNLIIGNEGNGIREEVLKLCNKNFKININLECESLNAAIAGSILMYELGGRNG